jgi:hypothetical protein
MRHSAADLKARAVVNETEPTWFGGRASRYESTDCISEHVLPRGLSPNFLEPLVPFNSARFATLTLVLR